MATEHENTPHRVLDVQETAESEREIVFERTVDAPRSLVWEMWTQPHHIEKWWGPRGFTNTIYEMNVRVGGVWSYMMHAPDGTDYPNKVTYLEVEAPSRLVFTLSDDYEDASKNQQFESTVTFVERDGKTAVTMRMLLASPAERAQMVEFGAIEGGHETLAKLAEYLESVSQ